MADDRLDDAIAAVVHAVDRIEQATRGVLDEPLPELPPRPAPPQPRMPPPPAFSPQSTGFAARPTTALGGLGAVPAQQFAERQPPFEPQPPYDAPLPMQTPTADTPTAFGPPTHVGAEAAPELAPSPDPSWSDYEPFFPDDPGPLPLPADQVPVDAVDGYAADAGDASATVHELVGRIVARTQALEDHLDAARQLRAEITELVSRLAAAAERDR